MADKSKESKWFKVATAGPTVDGREIKEQWLIDMAETYDMDEYTASIFQDHIGWFGNYGQVTAVKMEKDEKGRICLFNKLKPNKLLLEMNAAGQKLFTSIRVVEDFANTGKAYLMHLAITDEPASLGTEQLSFTQNDKQNEIFINEDSIELEFEKSLLQKIFSKQTSPTQEEEPMTDVEKAAFDKLQNQVNEFKTQLATLTAKDTPEAETPTDYAAQIEALESKITTLEDEKKAFATQAETLKTLGESFTKLESDFATAMKDKTETPPASTGETEFAVTGF